MANGERQETGGQEQVIYTNAEQILNSLGLKFEDLRNHNKVLDLGAGNCFVERAAKIQGINNVVSAGRELPKGIPVGELNYHQFDAGGDYPFDPDSFDLIIVSQGPFYYSKSQKEGVRMLEGALSVMKPEGKMRVRPVRFGFVKVQMFKDNENYARLDGIAPIHRTPVDRDQLTRFNMKANTETFEVLRNLGYNLQLLESGAEHVRKEDRQLLEFQKI